MQMKRVEDELREAEIKCDQYSAELHGISGQFEAIKWEKQEAEKKAELFKVQLQESHSNYELLEEENIKINTALKQREFELEAKTAELNEKIKMASTSATDLQLQNEQSAERIQELSGELERMRKENGRLQEESQKTGETNKKLVWQNTKLENELNMAYVQNESTIKGLEAKYEEIARECERLRSQCAEYKNAEEELKGKIEEQERARDKYKEQYIDEKKMNKQLRKKLDSIEQDVQLFVREREMEMRENLKREEAERYKEMTRIEALKDVHGKINQFKTDRAVKASPHKKI